MLSPEKEPAKLLIFLILNNENEFYTKGFMEIHKKS